MGEASPARYVDVRVGDIAHGGFCVGRGEDGRVVFARFALPGERVRVAVTREKSKLLYGDAVEVLEDVSDYRVAHVWEEAGPLGVGGADLGHVAFGWQTEWKKQVIEGALRRIGGEALCEHLAANGVSVRVYPCEGDELTQGWHTRTRIELVADSQCRLGMARPFSHDVVPLTSMPLAVPEIDELELFSGAWSGQLREGTRVKAVAASGSEPVVVIGNQVFSAPRMPTSPFVREDVVASGELYLYRLRASGFWQVHRSGPEQLLRRVLELSGVSARDRVLELYCGAGLFTQALAVAVGAEGRVDAFEGARSAVEDARANLRDMPWARVKTAAIDAAFISSRGAEDCDIAIADPPRAGLGVEGARAFAQLPARSLVLISCDPAAMARDVATMVASGRRVVAIESLDMFPNTHHVETVVLMTKK